jgi:hypothetical protein
MTLTRQQRQNQRSTRELTSRVHLQRKRRYSNTIPSVRNLRRVLKQQSGSALVAALPEEWKDAFLAAHVSRLRTWVSTCCVWQACESLFTLARADKERENQCKLENQLHIHRTAAYFIQHHLPVKVTLVYRRYQHRRRRGGREQLFYRCIKESGCRVRHQRTGGIRLMHPDMPTRGLQWDTLTATGLCEHIGDPCAQSSPDIGHIGVLCSRDLLLHTSLDQNGTVTFQARRRVLTSAGHVCTLRVFGELPPIFIPVHQLLVPRIGPCAAQVLDFLVC